MMHRVIPQPVRRAVSAACVSCLIGLVAAAQSPTVPGGSESYGAFGLPDSTGARILVMPWQDPKLADRVGLTRPDVLKTALCGRSGRVPVQFDRRQTETPNNGRASSANFDKLAGSVFRPIGRRLNSDSDRVCVLVSDPLLAGSTVLSIDAPAGRGACAQADRFSTIRSRRVVQCWPIARLGSSREIVLLEFELRGREALASLVLVDGPRAISADFTAEYRGPGEDLWRVDDEGKLSPEGLTIIGAIQRGRGYVMGTAWAGAEGLVLSLWTSDDADRFTKVLHDYWYQAPV